jgi:hypothetical protein
VREYLSYCEAAHPRSLEGTLCITFFFTFCKGHLPIPVAGRSKRVGLRPLACWDYDLESHRMHGYVTALIVVRCQVRLPASGLSLVQRSPTEFGVFECDAEASITRRSCHARNCCAFGWEKENLGQLKSTPVPGNNLKTYVCS